MSNSPVPGDEGPIDFDFSDPFGVHKSHPPSDHTLGAPAAPQPTVNAPAEAASVAAEPAAFDALAEPTGLTTDDLDAVAASGPPENAWTEGPLTVEALIEDLERVALERDTFLDDSRRLAAEFANFRRQTDRRNADVVEQAAASLVDKLLPVLDASEAAISHGAVEVEPIHHALITTLQKAGLSIMAPIDEPFDPAMHDAVMHEPGEGTPRVVQVFRSGYLWNGRVLRPAMVKVQG